MDIRPLISRYDLWSPQVTTTSSGVNFGSGFLDIETGWALCAIPVRYGYWSSELHAHVHDGVTVAKFKNYIYDQIVDLYGEGQIEGSNAFVGGIGQFYSFVPGSTPESSPHNFNLCYLEDGGFMEITGFWIKSINSDNMLISWGEVV